MVKKQDKKDYSKGSLHVTISRKILKKIDVVKMFPEWKGNKSSLVEYILEKFFENEGDINK